FAPSLAALWLTARAEGEAGVRVLLAHVVQWRVGWQWYLFAAGYVVAIKLAVALIYRVASGVWPRFGTLPWYVIIGSIIISTPLQAGGEIGWGRFSLPAPGAPFWRGSGV